MNCTTNKGHFCNLMIATVSDIGKSDLREYIARWV